MIHSLLQRWFPGRDLGNLVLTVILLVSAAFLLFSLHLISARLMPIEEYGSFAFGLTVGGFLALVCGLGFPNLVMRQAAAYVSTGAHGLLKGLIEIVVLRVGVASLLVVACVTGVAVLGPGLTSGQRSGLFLAALIVIFYPAGDVRAKITRGLGAVSGSIVPEELLRPGLFIAFMLLAASVLGPVDMRTVTGFFGMAMLASFVVGIVWGRRLLPFSWTRVTSESRKSEWLSASRRMLMGSVLQEITVRVDIIALGLFVTMSATAQYSACAKLAMLNTFCLKVIDIFYAPKMAMAHAVGDFIRLRGIIRMTMLLSLIGSLPLALVLLVAPTLPLGLFGEEYRHASLVLQILTVGFLINAATGSVGHALLMTGKEGIFARVTGMTAMLALAGHATITPVFGIVGAAVVTASATVFQNLVMLYFVRREGNV